MPSSNRISELPDEADLQQNYPNPFNPDTNIRFKLPESVQVSLKVDNTLGQQVDVIVEGKMEAGDYTVSFDPGDLSNGSFFYRLEAGETTLSRQMTLM